MKAILFLIVALFSISGCAVGSNPGMPGHVVLDCENTFTISELQAIANGAQSWTDVAGADFVSFEIRIMPRKEMQPYPGHLSLLREQPSKSCTAAGQTHRDAPGNPVMMGWIQLRPDMSDALAVGVVAHELGHAMGLDHTAADDPDIMNPHWTDGWGLPMPQIRDAQSIKNYWKNVL